MAHFDSCLFSLARGKNVTRKLCVNHKLLRQEAIRLPFKLHRKSLLVMARTLLLALLCFYFRIEGCLTFDKDEIKCCVHHCCIVLACWRIRASSCTHKTSSLFQNIPFAVSYSAGPPFEARTKEGSGQKRWIVWNGGPSESRIRNGTKEIVLVAIPLVPDFLIQFVPGLVFRKGGKL